MNETNTASQSITQPAPKELPNPPYTFEIVNTSPFDMQGRNYVVVYTNLNEMVLENVPADGGTFIIQYVDNGGATGSRFGTGCRYRIASNDQGLPMDFFDEALDDDDNQWWHIQHNGTAEIFSVRHDFGGGAIYSLIFPKHYNHREHTFNRGGETVPPRYVGNFTTSITSDMTNFMLSAISFPSTGPGDDRIDLTDDTIAPIMLPDPVTHQQVLTIAVPAVDVDDLESASERGVRIGNVFLLTAIGNGTPETQVDIPTGEFMTFVSAEVSPHSATYTWHPVSGGRMPEYPNKSYLTRYDFSGRMYCYANARWTTAHDDNYGSAYYQWNENCGTGAQPIVEWEHMGQPVKAGTVIHDLMMKGRCTDSLTIEDVQVQLRYVQPAAGRTYSDGLSADTHIQSTVISEFLWIGGNASMSARTHSIGNQGRRDVPVNFVCPADGEIRMYLRPVNVNPRPNANTDYFSTAISIRAIDGM